MGVLYTYEGLEHHAVALHTRDCVNTFDFFFSQLAINESFLCYP